MKNLKVGLLTFNSIRGEKVFCIHETKDLYLAFTNKEQSNRYSDYHQVETLTVIFKKHVYEFSSNKDLHQDFNEPLYGVEEKHLIKKIGKFKFKTDYKFSNIKSVLEYCFDRNLIIKTIINLPHDNSAEVVGWLTGLDDKAFTIKPIDEFGKTEKEYKGYVENIICIDISSRYFDIYKEMYPNLNTIKLP